MFYETGIENVKIQHPSNRLTDSSYLDYQFYVFYIRERNCRLNQNLLLYFDSSL